MKCLHPSTDEIWSIQWSSFFFVGWRTLTLTLWCKRSNKNREKNVIHIAIQRRCFQWLMCTDKSCRISSETKMITLSIAFGTSSLSYDFDFKYMISNRWIMISESHNCTHTTHTTRTPWHSGVRLNIVLELIIISRNKLGCWIEWFWMENKRQRLIYSAIAEFAVESARNSILQYQTRFGLHKHTSGSVQENSIPCSAF